ncbi:C4b-binding protein alpha chain-like isoform X2 [Electrophorus electricus]|uniref:C4b-binding protein alpha chain-like isoform X2 n=1 Tax=Electrophorus electricus TaxID=8005 RepID=UPI0015D06592|nr:C4b-binding protein alpha chain-like isoform X2 [Electrophorus electricus]
MSQRVIVLFTCLMVVTETRECERPSVGGNRILIEEPTNFPSGYEAKFKCATGYKPVNPTSSSVITCNGTQWTVLQLECKKKSCGSLGEIPNGMYIYSDGLQFGSTATAECKVGYKLVGDNTRNCFSDGWSGRNPVCEVVKCTKPPHIKNGELEDLIKEEYEYGEAVTYTCEYDFTPFGSLTISCSDDGTFQPSPPECLNVTCSEPDIQNGNRVQGAPPPYRYKQFVEYQCNSGYKMEGAGYLTCEEKGWNPPPPKCRPIATTKPKPRPSPGTLETIPGGYGSPRPPTTGPPTTTPPSSGSGLKLAFGLGIPILLATVVLVFFIKKRASRNERTLKVSTKNEDAEY